MIEWKMKYTELIDNVYVLKEMIDVRDRFKECVGFIIEEVDAIIAWKTFVTIKYFYFLNF